MTDFLDPVLTFIAENPSLAGLICFLAAMGEALFIIGLFVPTTVVLVGAGTLVGLGKLDPVPLFIWTTLGATAGDAISYWIGWRFKDKIKTMWPLNKYAHLVEAGEQFFQKHGGKSVFIGRFVPGVKSVVPGIAGMAGMNFTRFSVVNVTSAFAWTIVHIAPGIIAGSALGAIGQISGRLALVLGALLFVVFLIVMLGRWLILIVLPLFPNTHAAIVRGFARREDRVSQWIARNFDPAHPRSTGMLASALLLLITMPLFFWIVGEVAPGEPMVRADLAILNLFDSLRTPVGDKIMVFMTSLGDGVVVTAVTVAVAAYLFGRKAWRRGTGFIIAMAGTALFVPLFKLMLHRSRPIELYAGADAYSFPSGHATLTAVLFGICAVLIAHDLNRWAKASIFTIAASFVITIGFSRVYLGAHWMSDVLAGLLFGTAMVSAFAFVFGPIHNEKIGRATVAGIVVATLAVFGGWHISSTFDKALLTYEPRSNTEVLTASGWRQSGWQSLPARRIELNGDREEPLVIQYSGSLEHFAHTAEKAGWQLPPKWSLTTAGGFVEGKTPSDSLPILPRSQNGRQPDLVLIRKDTDEAGGRWVLRLWPSRYEILEGGSLQALYLGSVVHEDILRPMGEFSGPRTDVHVPDPADNPALLLPGAQTRQRADGIKVVLATGPEAQVQTGGADKLNRTGR
ncbi:bifunctional DedA family/phosphatase PAP2 family protein [Labrenzia sp. VG12]|uniref:bifunctional DedA family/phosphatase PAP2 family protein n=1 Tax=Labrenzia sp. VG12 TaxID=2021862 RepID=UPI000B8BF596|nr:bifunctional DedA family/phosphatase PAP2 family protein [Labrenzia sp. VG12]ASP35384.1 phosphoesterase PA-phosphatase [Labrenzia sp. VG12]